MAHLKDLIVNGAARVLGSFTASSIIKQGGTSNQFLKADGSIDSTSYYHSGNLTSSVIGNLGTLSNNISGNSATATKLQTTRSITLTGSVTGSVLFDGSSDVSLTTTTNKLNSTGFSSTGGLSYYQTNVSFDGSTEEWAHYIIANHGDGASYYHYTIRLPFGNIPQYRRQTGSISSVSDWFNFITDENILNQSVNYATLAGDADTVDGYHASAFAIAEHTHSYLPLSGGTMDQGSHVVFPGTSTNTSYGGSIEFREVNYVGNNQTDWAYAPGITFHWYNTTIGKFGLRSDGNLAWRNQSIIHSGNIGSQSVNYAVSAGDADTVDGLHASSFYQSGKGFLQGSQTYNTNWNALFQYESVGSAARSFLLNIEAHHNSTVINKTLHITTTLSGGAHIREFY